MTVTTLSDLIKMMRDLGVASLKWGDVEIHLGATPAPRVRDTDVAAAVDNAPKPRKIVRPGVRGKDGCTAEEQEELYGTVRDAIPPEYED